ncbi:MAG: hypothetical protein IPM97_06270 [Bdellovibrionaceae bacterium]|nr:hypothetical protein [Pseudobdellovibrionaceae bacterium]
MAKTKKKIVPAKIASKKPGKIAKPVAAKKPALKKAAKPVSKAPAAKHKKPSKAPTKAVAKKTTPVIVPSKNKKIADKKKSVVVSEKTAKKTTEKTIEKNAEKEVKKVTTPETVAAKTSPKKEAKASGKKGKTAPVKKEDAEEQDDFVADDDFGPDEMSEYEEELKAVEELDEEVTDEETWAVESKDKGDEEIYLTDAEGRRYCRSRDCDQIGIVDGYCRYHYLLFWRKIQVRKKILVDGKLERYVEELTSRYPDKFLEMIRRDMRTEKDFLGAIQELEIDESAGENEFEEDTTAYVEEIRGIGDGVGSGVEEEEF